ncbi:CrtK/TspO family sensor protein [Aureimonas ureilytica]|uniref:CrtK/TspO family sensor protein n=1 Tax=Aureimonas ureilytica TaxID=401562 RepID=A0A175RR34_9HYPH|nr:TspO/MBR family protein [Aureimonas ureilytica]KTR05798.1 CrtK/TspO family sensor protein [Aureimonas ureilytica]
MKSVLSLVIFLAVSLGGGAWIGTIARPDGWYRHLAKPWFNAPDWIFAPVWSVLYVLIALAGWRIWQSKNRKALSAWVIQMALNFLWPPLFFNAHATLPALVVILGLLASILIFLGRTGERDRFAFWCFVPYAVWVSYASLLNAAILKLNG